jgi:hypothetical protein
MADVAELADALRSGRSSFIGVWVRIPPSAPIIYNKRVWHNGCAPAFQAGYRSSTLLTRSIIFSLVGFPSGQRGQTVNLLR